MNPNELRRSPELPNHLTPIGEQLKIPFRTIFIQQEGRKILETANSFVAGEPVDIRLPHPLWRLLDENNIPTNRVSARVQRDPTRDDFLVEGGDQTPQQGILYPVTLSISYSGYSEELPAEVKFVTEITPNSPRVIAPGEIILRIQKSDYDVLKNFIQNLR